MKFNKKISSRSLLITTALILGLSFRAPAAAGTATAHKANKTNTSLSAIPQVLSNRKPRRHEPSFAISPDAVIYKLKQRQKISLVDVRNPKDFARLQIPGSLNIPLYAVKTKVFLKSFPVVLINEGFLYRRLEIACRNLEGLGFKAFILDGGLSAWKQRQGPLVGDLSALEEMKRVSPREFLRQKDYETTLTIDISPVQTQTSRQLMPYSSHIPVSAERGEGLRKLNRILADHKNQPFVSVVVFNQTGAMDSGVNKILAAAGVNAFWLQGGVAGYKRYLKYLILSWLPRDSRIETNRKCRPCSQETED